VQQERWQSLSYFGDGWVSVPLERGAVPTGSRRGDKPVSIRTNITPEINPPRNKLSGNPNRWI
jgi:hypothetical protein